MVVGCGIPQEDYDAMVAQRDAAGAEVLSLQSDLARVQSDLVDAENDLASLQSDLADTRNDLARVRSLLESAETLLLTEQGEYAALQSQISSLQSDLDEAEAWIAELEVMAVEVAKEVVAQVVPEGSQVGDLSSDFQLKDLDGKTVSLRDLQGSPVMLNFWATWCPPCRNEMPYLQQIYEEWQDKGLVILTINLRESTYTVRQFMQDNNYSLPVLLDTNGNVSNKYDVAAIPTTFFIDEYGVIQARKVGSFSSKQQIEDYLIQIMP